MADEMPRQRLITMRQTRAGTRQEQAAEVENTSATGSAENVSSSDNVAPCELSSVPDDEPVASMVDYRSASEEDATVAVPAAGVPSSKPAHPTKSQLELAIERLTALRDGSDTMVNEKWTKRAAPILKESLKFLAAYATASEAEKKAVRRLLRSNSGREPNVDNLPLIAVYMCVRCTGEKRTKAQRKAWCRFATVVKVAAEASIEPEHAARWLEKKTLNGILAEWRDIQKAAGKGARKPSVPKALKDYTHLAAALANGSEFRDLAMDELAKAEAVVGKAMAEAREAANRATAVDMPAEKVAADA